MWALAEARLEASRFSLAWESFSLLRWLYGWDRRDVWGPSLQPPIRRRIGSRFGREVPLSPPRPGTLRSSMGRCWWPAPRFELTAPFANCVDIPQSPSLRSPLPLRCHTSPLRRARRLNTAWVDRRWQRKQGSGRGGWKDPKNETSLVSKINKKAIFILQIKSTPLLAY